MGKNDRRGETSIGSHVSVQHLADVFWSRWRREYLPTLQPRRKWQNKTRNVQKGDLVIFRCKDAARNYLPLALITRAQADSLFRFRSNFRAITRLETLAAQAAQRICWQRCHEGALSGGMTRTSRANHIYYIRPSQK